MKAMKKKELFLAKPFLVKGRVARERISATETVVQLNRFKEEKNVEEKIFGKGGVSGVCLW